MRRSDPSLPVLGGGALRRAQGSYATGFVVAASDLALGKSALFPDKPYSRGYDDLKERTTTG